jgi:hypothetical protein
MFARLHEHYQAVRECGSIGVVDVAACDGAQLGHGAAHGLLDRA